MKNYLSSPLTSRDRHNFTRRASGRPRRARAPRRSGEKYRCRNETPHGFRELLPVVPEPGPEFVRRGVAQRRQVFDEKRHLLREPPPDDGVVLVEAERERLAIQDLLP